MSASWEEEERFRRQLGLDQEPWKHGGWAQKPYHWKDNDMKAQNESEALAHMAATLKSTGKLSGTYTAWRDAKVEALDVLANYARFIGHELTSMVDVGVGDLDHLQLWEPFVKQRVSYLGIDGCKPILDAARERFPGLEFRQLLFSELKEDTLDKEPDLLLACDVLYHIPEDAVYSHLVEWLFGAAGRFVILTHATDMTAGPGGNGPGSPGFGWIPRPFEVPRGWTVIHSRNSVAPSRQRLLVLEKG